jgi:hypothetical protein
VRLIIGTIVEVRVADLTANLQVSDNGLVSVLTPSMKRNPVAPANLPALTGSLGALAAGYSLLN